MSTAGPSGNERSEKQSKKSDTKSEQDAELGFWIRFAEMFLGKLINQEEAKGLANLAKKGSLALQKGNIPINLSNEGGGDKDLKGLLKLLCDSVKDPQQKALLAEFTEQDFVNVVSQLQTKTSNEIPAHFVKPATAFGSALFTNEDRDIFFKLKKNMNISNVTQALELVNMFHSENSCRFNRGAFLDILHFALPGELRQSFVTIRKACEEDIPQIFLSLSTRFDSSLSEEALMVEIERLIGSDSLSCIEIIKKIHANLLDTRSRNIDELSSHAFKESLRLISKRCSQFLIRQLKSFLMHSNAKENNFYNLYDIILTHFLDDRELNSKKSLPSNPLKKLLSNIEPNLDSDSVDRLVERLDFSGERENISLPQVVSRAIDNALEKADLKKLHESIENLEQKVSANSKPQGAKSKRQGNGSNSMRCYRCNTPGHTIKNCNKSRGSVNMYRDQTCAMHGPGHKNSECLLQRGPCPFAPNHVKHEQGQCRRDIRRVYVPNQASPGVSQQVPQPQAQMINYLPSSMAPPNQIPAITNATASSNVSLKQRILALFEDE